MSPVPIYAPGWRETKWSKVSCLRKQRDGRGLNPGPPDPEFKVLTARPHTPPRYVYTMPDSFRADTKSSKVFTPIRYVTLNFKDRRGAASFHNRNRAEITCVWTEAIYSMVHRAGAKVIRYRRPGMVAMVIIIIIIIIIIIVIINLIQVSDTLAI